MRIARECDVKRLVLFHHDPDSDDAFVDSLVARAQKKFPNTLGGAEGLEFCLGTGQMNQAGSSPRVSTLKQAPKGRASKSQAVGP